MGRSQESFNKKDVRNKKEKKRKEKEKKRLARKEGEKNSFDDMIAYVDENGNITSTPPDPTMKTEIKAEDIVLGAASKSDDNDTDAEHKGTVIFFDETKGFGFIKDKEFRDSVFVHSSNLLEPIKEGNLVSFQVEMGPKGPSAIQVKIVR